MSGPSVCVVAHAHPDLSRGGGEVAAHRQFRAMRAAGWPARFVAAVELPGGQAPGDRDQGIARYGEEEFLYASGAMEEDRLWWRSAAQRRALVEFLAGTGAGIYHLHHVWRVGLDLVAELAEARPDARLVLTLHEMLPICANHGQMVRTRGRELCSLENAQRCLDCFPERTMERVRLRKALFLTGLRRVHRFVCPSEFVAARYRAWGLDPARIAVLENVLDDDLLAAPRRTVPEPGTAGRFAFFGQAIGVKGLDVLVAAFALALRADASLTLSVHGATEAEVLALHPALSDPIAAAGPRLSFEGRYHPADLPALMAGAGWVVVPSVWWENSPVVIQEARRLGVPLIVSGIGGMAEKVRPGLDGLHARPGSAPDLARAMLQGADPVLHARVLGTLADVIGRDAFLDGLRAIYAPG